MINEKVRTKMLEIVENQLKINDPKCTKDTFERLIGMGYSKEEAKILIAGVLVEEMYELMKKQVPFNETRYMERLAKLK